MQLRAPVRIATAFAILMTSLLGMASVSATETVDAATAALIEKAAAEGPLPVIVELTTIAAQDTVMHEIAGLDATVTVQYDLFPLLALSAGPEAIAALAASNWVVSVREDIPQPPSLDTTLPIINGDDVQNFGWTGAGQTIAILDTGIDVDHDFFGTNGSRIVSQACYSNAAGGAGEQTLCPDDTNAQTTGNAADAEVNDCDPTGANLCDHGTHVAGIAAGATNGITGEPGNGVAPGANIIAIQVFTRINTPATCTTAGDTAPCVLTFASDQLLALQRVLALDATMTIAAVNMSLGGGMFATNCDTDSLKPAIDSLLAAGIATVISSGNSSFNNAVGAPGCISTAVTVGRTNDDDTIGPTGNRGPLLDIMAPGSGVNSAVVDDTFGFKGGTSMSAPHVAGAFAVLREAYPTATIATLLGYMTSTGVPISYDTDGNPGNDQTTPRLNLLAALQAGNTAPSVTAANASVTVNEGSTAANSGTFSDTAPENDPVTLSASIGTVTPASSPTGSGSWSWSFGTDDGPNQSQTVTISATDNKGEVGAVSFQLVVSNVAPTGDLGDTTVAEGSPAALSFSSQADVSSADTAAGFRYAFGDCAGGAPSVTTYASGSTTNEVSCTYGDNGSNPVTGRILDKDDGYSDDIGTVTVTNVAPTTSAPTFTANSVTGTVSAGFTYSDAGWLDTHTASFTWSIDSGARAGTIANAENVQPDATGTASDTRKLAPGCYTLTVSATVTDDDGVASAVQSIVSNQQVDVYLVRFEAPLKDNERNIARYGNVVPVTVSVISSCTGAAVTGLNLHVTTYQGAGDAVDSTPIDVGVSVSNADNGSQMREVASKYKFNLSTKGMTAGKDYTIQIRLDGNQVTNPEVIDAVLHPKR